MEREPPLSSLWIKRLNYSLFQFKASSLLPPSRRLFFASRHDQQMYQGVAKSPAAGTLK